MRRERHILILIEVRCRVAPVIVATPEEHRWDAVPRVGTGHCREGEGGARRVAWGLAQVCQRFPIRSHREIEKREAIHPVHTVAPPQGERSKLTLGVSAVFLYQFCDQWATNAVYFGLLRLRVGRCDRFSVGVHVVLHDRIRVGGYARKLRAKRWREILARYLEYELALRRKVPIDVRQ